MPQIEVTFDIDANGILNVPAKDRGTGKDQKITITSSSGLSKDEVERMAKDAEAHASEDKEKREQIEARNGLDSMVYNIEKMLKESGDKVSGSEKSDVESALADAKKTLEGTPSAGELNAAREKLTAASHKLAEAMYKATANAPTDGAQAAAGTTAEAGAESRRRTRVSSTPSTWTSKTKSKRRTEVTHRQMTRMSSAGAQVRGARSDCERPLRYPADKGSNREAEEAGGDATEERAHESWRVRTGEGGRGGTDNDEHHVALRAMARRTNPEQGALQHKIRGGDFLRSDAPHRAGHLLAHGAGRSQAGLELRLGQHRLSS